MEIKIIKDWRDITLGQFIEISSVLNTEYEDEIEKGIALVSVTYGIDANTIPFSDFKKLLETLKFTSQPMVKKKVVSTYTLNGRKYGVDLGYTAFTTSQYIDFQSYSKQNDLVGVLSAVVIPDGKAYNSDYDIEEVKNDLLEMSVADAMSIINFFLLASKTFTKRLAHYLTRMLRRRLKKAKLTKEQMREVESKMKELEAIMNMEYSHIF